MTATQTDGLHVTDTDGVRLIELDRPESKNGLTVALVQAIGAAVGSASTSSRVVVLAGRGGAFCSGLDLKAAMVSGLRAGPEVEQNLREHFHGLIRALVTSPLPTIAAVDGAAAGFGCDLALACDIRVVSARGRFGEIFVKRGLMPDGGGTWLLPRIVGLGRALDLLLSGDMVDADAAMAMGLATRKVAPVDGDVAAAVHAFAAGIAAGPPGVHALIKASVYAGLGGDLDGALDREARGQLACLGSRDFLEGITAFMQKRPPRFTGA